MNKMEIVKTVKTFGKAALFVGELSVDAFCIVRSIDIVKALASTFVTDAVINAKNDTNAMETLYEPKLKRYGFIKDEE